MVTIFAFYWGDGVLGPVVGGGWMDGVGGALAMAACVLALV